MLFVGINPGVRSAVTGHHFAGYSNRFWKLLWESKLVPEKISSQDDERLLEWGYGMTNLIARPSPGIDDLSPAEYLEGWKILEKKVERFRPEIVAFVGDNILDFPALNQSIKTQGEAAFSEFGVRFFLIPNPMYGSWQ